MSQMCGIYSSGGLRLLPDFYSFGLIQLLLVLSSEKGHFALSPESSARCFADPSVSRESKVIFLKMSS